MPVKARFGFVLESVKDIEAAKQFYTEVLGLEMERYHPTFVQFKNFAIGSDPANSERGNKELEMYWLVDDVEAAYQELSKQGQTTTPIKDMPYGRLFGIKDPAGRPSFLIEFARERPSKPVQ